MILIDSLYVNNSGGLILLKYLIPEIEKEIDNVFFLIDQRCQDEFINIPAIKKKVLKPSIYERNLFYITNKTKFTKVLCFGNIPPPIKIKAEIYTYFHNINLLEIPNNIYQPNWIRSAVKQCYIYLKKHNTDKWIVQTNNTKKVLMKTLSEPCEKVLVHPFFPKILNNPDFNNDKRKDYIYVSNYTKEKNHKTLLLAWQQLFHRGYLLTLHLTLSNHPRELEILLKKLISQGVPIINHGFVKKERIEQLYNLSKATIYPSINESFGLGIIEALQFGCDVIGPDLPYLHSVCYPSCTFKSNDINSIVNSIIEYEKNDLPISKILVFNELDQLLQLIK
ncbi:MAG: glycosyltransferase [Bacteroidales bacterium]|nr:glycosyltransferase [Bacteroidales bacterium]